MDKSPSQASFEKRYRGIEPSRSEQRVSDPPPGSSHASAAESELRARIETWMNEGGAGGDVTRRRLSRLGGAGHAKRSSREGGLGR
jgi:hypothetical protein